MRLFKDRVWKELHERVVNEDHIGKSGLWSSRDSEIFNSYPFKLLCEKVEELEDKLRGVVDFTIRDSVILSDMIINEIKKRGRYVLECSASFNKKSTVISVKETYSLFLLLKPNTTSSPSLLQTIPTT